METIPISSETKANLITFLKDGTILLIVAEKLWPNHIDLFCLSWKTKFRCVAISNVSLFLKLAKKELESLNSDIVELFSAEDLVDNLDPDKYLLF